MELFTTPDSEEREGSDLDEQSMHDDFWLPDAPVLPPSPEKKKMRKTDIVVNFNNDLNLAEATLERRKNALIRYIAATKVASPNSNDQPPATHPTTEVMTVARDAEALPQPDSPVFVPLDLTDEETPLAINMRVSAPSPTSPTGMTPGDGLDSSPESDANLDYNNGGADEEKLVTYNISDGDEDELQTAFPLQSHDTMMVTMDCPGEGEEIDAEQTLEVGPSTASSDGVRRRRFRQPNPRSRANSDEDDDFFKIISLTEYHERRSLGKSSAVLSPQQPNTGRTPEGQYSTPSSAGTSDAETQSEDAMDPSRGRELVTTPSQGALQRKKNKQKSHSKGLSEVAAAKIPTTTRPRPKKRNRADDEDSSFEREPKRQVRVASTQNRKGKGTAVSLSLGSEQKIKLRESAMNAIW
jgi:hypothetical protein